MKDLKGFCTHFTFFFASLSLMRQLLFDQSDLVILLAQYFHLFVRQIEIGTFSLHEVSKYGVFSGPYFPAFGLNTERYHVPLRIQSKCGKIPTRKKRIWTLFRSVYCSISL